MRISDLSELADIPVSTVRFYERQALLPQPERTSGGYRDYSEQSVERLRFIRRGQDAGLALADIRDILAIRDSGQPPCGHVQELLVERLESVEAQIRELASLQQHLIELLGRAEQGPSQEQADAPVCWILEGESS